MFIISIIVFALFMLGIFVDYVTTKREKNQTDKNKRIVKLQSVFFKGQHLLNGRLCLPLTVLSSVVCLQRTLAALNAIIRLESTVHRIEVKADLDKKLANFNSLPATQAHFYSLLALPQNLKEQVKMLKSSALLVMVLKVEQSNGYVSIDSNQAEVDQLDILNTRLRSSIYGLQATEMLEKKSYGKSKALSDKAMALLVVLKCDNEEVTTLIDEQIAALQLINDGIAGVIDEKNHTFYDKFKDEARLQDGSNDGLHRAVNYDL
ncbi:MAG: hypothetical protein HRT55_07320 [Colwellia sp.]|uniref:hypothetical protein n=1 Tax=Colwellia sp. TaxID=56799 RepID=UPI0025BB8DD2|nr:hypothetical protein [Colwellia sp.]NQZ26110.1 hypothetical protein [Colwellia sp.]